MGASVLTHVLDNSFVCGNMLTQSFKPVLIECWVVKCFAVECSLVFPYYTHQSTFSFYSNLQLISCYRLLTSSSTTRQFSSTWITNHCFWMMYYWFWHLEWITLGL